MHTRPTLTSNPDTIFNIYCELLKKHYITLNIPLYNFGGDPLEFISFPTGPKVEIWALESSHKRFSGWKDSIKRLGAIKRPPKSLLLGNMVSGIVLTTIFFSYWYNSQAGFILYQISNILSIYIYRTKVQSLPGLVNDSLNHLRTPVVETWIMWLWLMKMITLYFLTMLILMFLLMLLMLKILLKTYKFVLMD